MIAGDEMENCDTLCVIIVAIAGGAALFVFSVLLVCCCFVNKSESSDEEFSSARSMSAIGPHEHSASQSEYEVANLPGFGDAQYEDITNLPGFGGEYDVANLTGFDDDANANNDGGYANSNLETFA